MIFNDMAFGFPMSPKHSICRNHRTQVFPQFFHWGPYKPPSSETLCTATRQAWEKRHTCKRTVVGSWLSPFHLITVVVLSNSKDYGCLSDTSVQCAYDNVYWFLDSHVLLMIPWAMPTTIHHSNYDHLKLENMNQPANFDILHQYVCTSHLTNEQATWPVVQVSYSGSEKATKIQSTSPANQQTQSTT